MVTSILPLRLENVTVEKKGIKLIDGLNYEFPSKGITFIIGGNGVGKTTLLRLIHQLEQPSQGRMIYNRPMDQIKPHSAFVFQSPILLYRSVYENLKLPLKQNNIAIGEIQKSIEITAKKFKIDHLLQLQAHDLSGGQKQKVAIARAWIAKPQLLSLDEPCANLDAKSVMAIEKMILEISQHIKIIMTSHDIRQAKRLADHILLLDKGKQIAAASKNVFFRDHKTLLAHNLINGDIIC